MAMTSNEQVNQGDIIQVTETCSNSEWVGCTMIVDEVKNWGITAYLKIPMKGNAYLRIKHGDYEVVGKAALLAAEAIS